MSDYVPKELEELIKEIVAHTNKEQLESEEEYLDRLYAEILPEEYYPEEEEDDSWKIEIQV